MGTTKGQGMLGEEPMGDRNRRDERLERIGASARWDAAAAALSELRCADGGRPGFPVRVMVEALLLQQRVVADAAEVEALRGGCVKYVD